MSYERYETGWSQLAYFPRRRQEYLDRWERLRRVGRDNLTPSAQLRLEWIIFYHTVGRKNARTTATHFGISPKTFHKWKKRFKEEDLTSLEELSRRPNQVRSSTVSILEEQRIRAIRGANPYFGKVKLKHLYCKHYREEISTWKIERTIRKFNLYPDKIKRQIQIKRKRGYSSKLRINKLHPKLKQNLWHTDTVEISWYGTKRYILTAVHETTRLAYARVYQSPSSKSATDFLKRLLYLTSTNFKLIHHDNGSEFRGAFEKACQDLDITQVYSRVKTPKDNPKLERFNRTLQEEWLDYSRTGLEDLELANLDLTDWLIKYNFQRPHHSLGLLTPIEYTKSYYPQVLPMSPASTRSCVRVFGVL
jgi:transposase InsO family protein/transposase-like protein